MPVPGPASVAQGGLRAWLERLAGRFLGDQLGRRLARGAAVAFVVNVLGMGVALLSQLVLARLLGVEGYGAYAYMLGWVNFLVVPAMLGLNTVQLRFVAAYRSTEAWGLMRGVIAFGDRLVGGAGLACAGAGILIVWLLGGRLSPALSETFLIGLLTVPLLALLRTRAASVRGLGRVASALAPDLLTRHLALLVVVGGMVLVQGGAALTPGGVAAATVATTFLALAIVSWSRARALPAAARTAAPVEERALWLRTAAPLLILGSLQILTAQASLLMIGWLGTTAEAGIYAVVTRLSALVMFPFTIVSFVFAPVISQLYTEERFADLQRAMTTTAWWTTVGALAVALPLMLFPEAILGLFGPGFTTGATALRLLLLSGLVYAVAGPAGFLLTMTGLERAALVISACAVLTAIGLNLVLVPRFGIEGAAVAAVAASAVWKAGVILVGWWRYRLLAGIFASFVPWLSR